MRLRRVLGGTAQQSNLVVVDEKITKSRLSDISIFPELEFQEALFRMSVDFFCGLMKNQLNLSSQRNNYFPRARNPLHSRALPSIIASYFLLFQS
jgi:hypothetical protein